MDHVKDPCGMLIIVNLAMAILTHELKLIEDGEQYPVLYAPDGWRQSQPAPAISCSISLPIAELTFRSLATWSCSRRIFSRIVVACSGVRSVYFTPWLSNVPRAFS